MATTEGARLQLHDEPDEPQGREQAMTTETLPPEAWKQLATKSDLALVRTELNAKIDTGLAEVRGEIKTGLAEVRGEIKELRGEMTGLRGEMTGLRGEMTGLRGEMTGELKELRGEMKHDMARQTRTMVFTMIGVAVTIWLALLLPIGGA